MWILLTCLILGAFSGFSRAVDLSDYCADKPNGKYTHPVCTKFIHCSNHITSIKDCAAGTRYNSVSTHCDFFSNVDCSDRGACFNKPCKNGGTCVRKGDDYTCRCLPGYTGKDCDEKVEPCDRNPCKNGGTCTNVGDSYRCDCPPGFKGKDCGTRDPCDPNPCQNGGRCTAVGDSYHCICPPGYKGKDCHIRNPCDPHPCKNGGTCTAVGDSYHCACPSGYKGKDCQTRDPCDPNPCQNGGKCSAVGDSYHCVCPIGYRGKDCHIRDPCEPNPCKNGGRCTHVGIGYMCVCPLGYEGKHCQIINHCRRLTPCQNGGTCVNLADSYRCNCPPGYTGDRCHVKIQCRDSNGCTYDVGMRYTNAKCSASCTCMANGNNACVSLCPPRVIRCLPGYTPEEYYEPVRGTWCYCKRKRCVRVRALVDCRTAAPGRYPHPTDCSFYLLCENKLRHTVQCGNGQHFNSKTKLCDSPQNAKCGSVTKCL